MCGRTGLPKKYIEDGPRIVEFPREGKPPVHQWVYEGRSYPNIGLNAVAGKSPEEFGRPGALRRHDPGVL